MGDAVEIEGLLRDRGLDTAEAVRRGRTLLEAAGLTRPGKLGMAAEKVDRAIAVLGQLVLVCGQDRCRQVADQQFPGQEQVEVGAAKCSVCAGSDVARAATAMATAMTFSGLRRLLVLGGTPAQHRELLVLLQASPVEVRCIDGSDGAHTRQQATGNLEWADVVVLWASTPLAHKVSQAYTNSAGQRARTPQITVARRSLTALCEAVMLHLRSR